MAQQWIQTGLEYIFPFFVQRDSSSVREYYKFCEPTAMLLGNSDVLCLMLANANSVFCHTSIY